MSLDATPGRLGAEIVDGGVVFRLLAPHARRVQLSLIDNRREQTHLEMTSWDDDVWSLFVPDIGAGQLYGYRVHGVWSPATGQRSNPAQLLCDPYARAITGGIDYRGPIYDHLADDVYRPDPRDSLGSVPLSVVVADTPPPTPIARRRSMAESVIYELHVRGFTKLHPAVPEHLRGTYSGLAYPEVIEYLQSLGITAVELLPVHHFVSEPFVALKGLTNYWGYNTLGFFAPHAGYGQRGGVASQVEEFKNMVSALHQADIEVILDVVYNHTAEGGQEGPSLSFRGIDQSGYYRLGSSGAVDHDVTGCGNSVDTSQAMAQQLVLDSMAYWVTEMGIDGFRFDLATTLMRDGQHHVDMNHPLKHAIEADERFAGVKLIAEPWDVGPFGYQVGAYGPGWSEWNDHFRDHVRDFWRGSGGGVRELATRLAGSPDLFDAPGRSPGASVNYVTSHDGFTMLDLVSYDVKHNQANGESNRDGTDNNRSWNHGWEGPTKDPVISALRGRQVLNFFATLVLAGGTPMITAGDEMGRTQQGNNNAYCQDSPISWVNWDTDEQWSRAQQRVRDLIELRARNPLLRTDRYLYHQEILDPYGESLDRVDLTWMDGLNGQMGESAWHDPGRKLLGMYVSNDTDAWLMWFHAGAEPEEIRVPKLPWGAAYDIVWHSAEADELPTSALSAGEKWTIPARCVVVMRAEVPDTAADLARMNGS